MADRLTMLNICNYAQATFSSRNYIEGEQLINSGHVIYCGCKSQENVKTSVVALCLQTSALKEAPHEINGCLIFENEQWKIENMMCSCKAGASRRCKHIVATLMYLNRNNITELEVTSQTDLKCLWNQTKDKSLQQYIPKPLMEHSGIFPKPQKEIFNISAEVEEQLENLLLNINIDTDRQNALRLHRLGRHEPQKLSGSVDDSENDMMMQILNCAKDANLQLNYHQALRECCQNTLRDLSKVNVFEICKNTKTSKNMWKQVRQFRITGSRCYALFTYASNKNPDWQNKSEKYFYPKGFSNVYVKHGIENEPVARAMYKETNNVVIFESGFIVCQSNPWLGYSPDGVIFSDGKPSKLLEIKCPYEGRKTTVKELLKNCNFLFEDNGVYQLKTRHAYYGQIQLGMAILNISSTDFVIFSSCDRTFYTITVNKDCNFINNMLSTLKRVYFDHMLHVICNNNQHT